MLELLEIAVAIMALKVDCAGPGPTILVGAPRVLEPVGDVLPIIEAGGVFDYAKKAGMLK